MTGTSATSAKVSMIRPLDREGPDAGGSANLAVGVSSAGSGDVSSSGSLVLAGRSGAKRSAMNDAASISAWPLACAFRRSAKVFGGKKCSDELNSGLPMAPSNAIHSPRASNLAVVLNCYRWFLFHSKNALNNSARCWSETGAPLLPPFCARKVSKFDFDAVLVPCLARLIQACAAGDRCHPSSVAAKFTSRHFGWRGGFCSSSNFEKKASTNLATLR